MPFYPPFLLEIADKLKLTYKLILYETSHKNLIKPI